MADWLTNTAETGEGKFAANPESPVSLAALVMTGMMNPGAIGDLLGMTAE